MKIRLMLSFLAILVLSSFTTQNKTEQEIPVIEIEEVIVAESPTIHELQELMDAIGYFESNNRYDIVNPYGFMGRYQFSPRTVEYLGYNVTKEEFLNNPELQDSVMVSYIRDNYVSLRNYIDEYAYTTHNGIYITPSSILAGAHFAGAGGMKKFLRSDEETVDSNGMTITRYMKKFTDYEINLEEL